MHVLQKIRLLIGALIILTVTFGSGFYLGFSMPDETRILGVLQKEPPASFSEEVDFAPFWEAWKLVENRYVNIDDVGRQDMVYGAISGLLRSLEDPYTVFFDPEALKLFQSEINGSFEGVGMEIGIRKGALTVIAPLKDSPAERAGIKAGDKIIRIDDTSTIDITIEEAVRLIRGQQGTKVKLTLLRNGEDEPHVIEVTRDVINIPVIKTDTQALEQQEGTPSVGLHIPEDIFLVELYSFSEQSPVLFQKAVREMALKGKRKLILDLRNNPGGFLEAAVQISSWFLPEGELVVTEEHGKDNKKHHRSYGYNVFRSVPMVILVNQGSASASEIVAGALQDYGIATLVGEKTFGKGSVQELLPLTSDTALKITIAKWLTPKGRDISAGGLVPDYEIKPTEKDTKEGRDIVLEKAIQLLQR